MKYYVFNNKKYIIINPGKIVRKGDRLYQVQLVESTESPIEYKSKKKFEFSRYGLDEQSYFNLIVYGNPNFIPKCNIHGNNLIFVGLHYGYSEYCSRECAELGRRRKRSEHLSNLYKNGTNPIYSKISRCKADRSRYLLRNNTKNHSSLYIAIPTYMDNSIKIGISRDIERRSSAFNRTDYSSINVILEGDDEYIANIEYEVKIKFIEYSIGNYTELFNSSLKDDIINFINSIK